jgi:hypothetical protein
MTRKIRWTLTGTMDEDGSTPEEVQQNFALGEYEFADLEGISENVKYEFKWEEAS